MLMLALDLALGVGKQALPSHLGGVLHGFVERAVLAHANHLSVVLRPDGIDEYASLAIEPPPYGQTIEDSLRFGIVLFRDAVQSWSVILRALVEQARCGINNRAAAISQAWIVQPGSAMQAVLVDSRLLDPVTWAQSPAAWVRGVIDEKRALHESESCTHTLDFRSPLLVGSRGSTRRDHAVPWPTLKTLLDSIAKRILALAPELANAIGITQDWRANDRLHDVIALTPVATPATQIQWQYSAHRGILKPGIVGKLVYVSQLSPAERALLDWGQWLGVGQQTTMGCGRYIYRSN